MVVKEHKFPEPAGAKPATEVLTSEQQTRHITTLCQELDEILGGGIAPGQLTEICESLLPLPLESIGDCP